MFRGFGEQHPTPLRTGDVVLVLVAAGATVTGPALVVWWGWRHGFWLSFAAQLTLPPSTALWARRRYNWHPLRRR
ncbi:hypothetical protein AB0J38_27895 [Streptomyces sp. NPDC050095]|uniref:hypothetical protein n=1 Tax=unclassified Streptomyces TaxID=2593676 RepID=UPI0034391BE0